MTKPESEWTWKELPVGNVVLEPGNASQYRTGDWKSFKPILNKELCIHCGKGRGGELRGEEHDKTRIRMDMGGAASW